MRAIDAAEHSPYILASLGSGLYHCFIESNGKWYDVAGDEVDLQDFPCEFVPLVPKKIYKVGDKVTFLEALNSGMCFRDRAFCYRLTGDIFELWQHTKNPPVWEKADGYAYMFFDDRYTLCEDPSIPPKPTLESLPAWTRCKVKPVNYTVGICDVIKKPGGSFEYYDSGNGFGFVNIELIAVYNPKTEQWEDV